MRNLLVGLLEWRIRVRPHLKDKFAKLALGQQPDVLFIGCSDSRVAVNVFASTRPGETFVIRNVGNLVPPSLAGSHFEDAEKGPVGSALEFGINALKVKHVIVCGHSSCGAVNAITQLNGVQPHHHNHNNTTTNAEANNKQIAPACSSPTCTDPAHFHSPNIPAVPGMPSLSSWLRWGHPTAHAWKAGERIDGNNHLPLIDQMSQLNVKKQVEHLFTYDVIRQKVAAKEISVHGWWFDIGAAAVYSYHDKDNRFRLIDLNEANRIMESIGEKPINQDLVEAMRGDVHDYSTILASA